MGESPKPRKIPSYCRHKATGQAVVRIRGQDKYLGKYGTPDSYERYYRLTAELLQSEGNGNIGMQVAQRTPRSNHNSAHTGYSTV